MKHKVRAIIPPTSMILAICLLCVGVAFGGEDIDDETCLGCHDGQEETLDQTAHKVGSQVTDVTCVSCHTGGAVHAEDPSAETIGNPANMEDHDLSVICTACHQPHMNGQSIGFDVHLEQSLSCVDCHTVHVGDHGKPALDDPAFCSQCHVSVNNDFMKRSDHPVADGTVTCVSCHDFLGQAEPDFGYGSTYNCTRCHPETSGPFLHEHEATSSFSSEGDGCAACHSPHGSPTERLVKMTGDRLCQQCHFQTAAHTATAHGGQYAGYTCGTCHSEIHGSYEPDNRLLFDANLGAKLGGTHSSCYCH